MRKSRPFNAARGILLLLAIIVAPNWGAAQNPRFIRDSEIEATIRDYATPVFKAAGLDAQSIDVFLIANDQLNAFVAGGMNMFLHTGLLQRAEGPLQVMGVIAHEAGHISGGHIAARRRELRDSTTDMLATYALGLAAALATGRSDAGLAVAQAGQGAVMANLLAYTRGQEGAADQAAVDYLNDAGYSPEGLLEFMKIMEDQQALLSDNQDPYLRTHPLTQNRISFLEKAVSKSPHTGDGAPTRLRLEHARMTAKLDGFLKPPRETLRKYKGQTDVPGRYARAIAHFRDAALDKALAIIDELIAEYPKDPYFRELKGQMLYEHGKIAEALPAYEKAVALKPGSALLRLGLARTQVQLNESDLNEPALENLGKVLRAEPRNTSAWRLRAIAYGRQGDTGMTAWSLAEARLTQGDPQGAIEQSRRAMSLLDKHSPHWLRAQDIRREAKRRIERREQG